MNLREPHATRLREMIIEGAAVQDIHDAPGTGDHVAPTASISEAYIRRELTGTTRRPGFVAPALAWAVPMLRWPKQLFRKG